MDPQEYIKRYVANLTAHEKTVGKNNLDNTDVFCIETRSDEHVVVIESVENAYVDIKVMHTTKDRITQRVRIPYKLMTNEQLGGLVEALYHAIQLIAVMPEEPEEPEEL